MHDDSEYPRLRCRRRRRRRRRSSVWRSHVASRVWCRRVIWRTVSSRSRRVIRSANVATSTCIRSIHRPRRGPVLKASSARGCMPCTLLACCQNDASGSQEPETAVTMRLFFFIFYLQGTNVQITNILQGSKPNKKQSKICEELKPVPLSCLD